MLRARGIDPAQIRAGMGWRSEIVQDGYTRWEPEQLGALKTAVAGLLTTAASSE